MNGWSASGGAVDGYYFPKYEGEYSLVFSNNDSIWQEISLSETASSPIIISCWVEISCFWGEGEFELKGVLKGDGINEEHSTEIITGSCDWTQLSVTIDSIPEGTSSCEIKLIKRSGVGYMFLDNVACELEMEQEISTKYIYAGSRLLAKEENGNLHFYHLDRIGSPIMITDESGAVVKEKKYEAFGNLVWEEGSYEDKREFTSKEKDPTGFHYFGARYYSGDIGRFLTPDPHTVSPGGLELTDPQTLNPYVYCLNNPLSYFDPDGLMVSPVNLEARLLYMYYDAVLPQVGGCHCGPGSKAKYLNADFKGGYNFSRSCQIHDMTYATKGMLKAMGDLIFKHAMMHEVMDKNAKGKNVDFEEGLKLKDKYYNVVNNWFIKVTAYRSAQSKPQYEWKNGKLKYIGKDRNYRQPEDETEDTYKEEMKAYERERR